MRPQGGGKSDKHQGRRHDHLYAVRQAGVDRDQRVPERQKLLPPEKFLAERVASQGLDNTADWDNIDQQVGTLADQIVAKIC